MGLCITPTKAKSVVVHRIVGAVVKGEHDDEKIDFYGVLTDIIVLNYLGETKYSSSSMIGVMLEIKKMVIYSDVYITSINIFCQWYKDDPLCVSMSS